MELNCTVLNVLNSYWQLRAEIANRTCKCWKMYRTLMTGVAIEDKYVITTYFVILTEIGSLMISFEADCLAQLC